MCHRRNAYLISEQGKPPDFVLEIASRATGQVGVREKRQHYAEFGIPEYRRFDETGEFHGARLAGDRLVDNVYVPVAIEERPDGVLQGYSAALNPYLRWENGQLVSHDPATGQPILTCEDQRERAEAEREHAEAEHDRADAEHQARARAEELPEVQESVLEQATYDAVPRQPSMAQGPVRAGSCVSAAMSKHY